MAFAVGAILSVLLVSATYLKDKRLSLTTSFVYLIIASLLSVLLSSTINKCHLVSSRKLQPRNDKSKRGLKFKRAICHDFLNRAQTRR